MRTKCLQVLLAFFWLMWTGIVLPGHTPGIVPMESGGTAGAGGATVQIFSGAVSCPFCAAAGKNDAPSKPPSPATTGCALCDLKAKLYSGQIAVPALAPHGLLEIAAAERATEPPGFLLILTSRSRAPPFFPVC